ncbi:GntP family permease [Pseudoflavitalea sp. G-6-1-2]|uniref:GntP family permease n=1 Tax=Pseudoflavitalea sp. G-6-1-2 TaxID=2728841 RepID=UPI00146E335C|nr:GntP family permease [Pseudoflavitalea sp. G-6-1-2]NML19731.1 GntP family permease [Pseudoflavitalea sp. G-6-1-2]
MNASFLQVLICLAAGIVLIILLTAKYRVHAFFALLLACFVVGIGVQMPVPEILKASKEGFGNIMRSLGLIIVLGTTLGVLLEHTGCTRVMADYILRRTGEKRAPLAMSITGFVVGLPIFCDSGFIVLSGLNHSIAKRTGISMAVMAVSLATGLYAVHCLLPPHPGAAAAAGTIGVDYGKLIGVGVLVAIPSMIIGYAWAIYAGKKWPETGSRHPATEEKEQETIKGPKTLAAFLPVIVPILLIALHSFFVMEKENGAGWQNIILIAGEPVIALSIGILLAFAAGRQWKRDTVSHLLTESAEKAGGILVIIGAGGAFGAVLAATGLGKHLGNSTALENMGIFFPFLLTAVLKTAQGSSTVAIITAASIVQPLLPAMGLDSENGRLITVLAMGAGSMMISHANDAYFWVIAKFSGLNMRTMLRVYTLASIWMGLVTLLTVYILSRCISY